LICSEVWVGTADYFIATGKRCYQAKRRFSGFLPTT